MSGEIKQLIINSPYEEPTSHWRYNSETKYFDRVGGRRLSGYFVAKKGAKSYSDDEGVFVEIENVNRIRERVREWRANNYPGITNTTRRLIEHWHDNSARYFPFFFCQLDAIETLIFLCEAPADMRNVIITNDGGNFKRLCTKLCTGGGKTIVMSMLIAWQVCSSVNYPRDKRFTKYVMCVAPNLTVKKRLQVLRTDEPENYYARFCVVPPEMNYALNQGKIIIHNWQALSWESEEQIAKRKSVEKIGAKSDSAYAREVLHDMPGAKNILVINDEAHHAYRVKPDDKKIERAEREKATVWIQGLDRIDRARGIMTCYDFSATPFVPGRGRDDEEGLFSWIVSDFGLNDGIESGLVKTPRVVVNDNAVPDPETFKSKLYHIYADDDVKADINSPKPCEASLPDLVRNAYFVLGLDWQKVFREWKSAGKKTPPVMITAANRTETAARIEYAFIHGKIDVPELCGEENILRIDSRKLEENSSDTEYLREAVDTVGQEGRTGEQLRNIISVGMLSEGWDARTVTHIMGLRAFTSQLLCEQVVGRGLRRTSYDRLNDGELFAPEYVNVFGIPFTFLPHEDAEGRPRPTAQTDIIQVIDERREYEISWPNVERLEYVVKQTLSIDVDDIPVLELKADGTRINVEIAPVVDGKANLSMCSDIDIERLYAAKRMQEIIFDTAGSVYDEMSASWQKEGMKINLLGQVIGLTEKYLRNGKIKISPELFITNEHRKKIIISLNMERIIRHIWQYITSTSTEEIRPVLSKKRECSTGEMHSWYTARPNGLTKKSHINRCTYDSTWEESEAYSLDRNSHVKAWAKNDHLGFHVCYMFNGVLRRYFPDFLVRLENDITLILEVKGQEHEQDRVKRAMLHDWIRAVNSEGHFGKWACNVSRSAADIDGIIAKFCR